VRSNIRISFLALVVGALVLLAAAPGAFAVEGSFAGFFAGNCKLATCGAGAVPPTLKEEEEKGFRQAGGYVPFGVTDFTLTKYPANNKTFAFEPLSSFSAPVGFPAANLKNLRVDVAPGVVTNGLAVPKCSLKDFNQKELDPVHHLFEPPICPASSIIGKNEVEAVVEKPPLPSTEFEDAKITAKVYNLEPANGQGTTYGVALAIPGAGGLVVHTIIQGSVEFKGDYHDYFVIQNISPGLIESRLVFFGAENEAKTEKTGFIRNPTACTIVGPESTTTDTGEFAAGAEPQKIPYVTKVATECPSGLKFGPTFGIVPESALSDQTDGVTIEAKNTHPPVTEPDSADLKTAVVKLPEGLTMNPSAGAGLAACTPKQAGVTGETRAIKIQEVNPIGCPGSSRIGTVTLEVPTLPPGSLRGPIFLGQAENAKGEAEPITGPPYTVYLDAESSRYGLRVLLKSIVTPNPATGQITATFTTPTSNENPPAPFERAALQFNGGPFAPLANPLTCGNGAVLAEFTAFSGAATPSASVFGTIGCPSSGPPFTWTQNTSSQPKAGGGNSEFTFNLSRNEGQQYLASTKVVLPPGLVGKIPAVTQCTEAQVKADEAQNVAAGCPLSSKIGTVTATAGSGTPFQFTGNAYLTAPLSGEGAPYDILSVVPIVAGPVNLGYEVTRSKIEVNPNTARVVVATPKIPTIRGGIPTRLRSLSFNITTQNYILNPTNCGVLATESTLTSTLGATQNVSSPFQVEGCSSLGFKPSFKATTFGRPSKALGASLETTINQPPGQANIKSVVVSLPRQLPSRLTTLQKACPEATFAVNPYNCPTGSLVGGARANTPVLPGKMSGPAYLVSHGGAAFPDLDLVLEANGVRVIVTGNTDIKKGVTTTSFLTGPDVPISSITVNLPIGPHSALAANGALCGTNLVMPTTITGQNGKTVKQNTKIGVAGCGVRIVGHKVIGNTAFLTVQTFSAGRISGSGASLATVYRTLGAAARTATLKVPLTRAGQGRRRPLHTRVRVGFVPRQRGAGSSAAFVNVTFG
jgi:hypothetical protein